MSLFQKIKFGMVSIFILFFIGCGDSATQSIPLEAELNSSKESYFSDENISIAFKNVDTNRGAWITIRSKNGTYKYKDIILREDLNHSKEGEIFLGHLDVGLYQSELFYKESLHAEANSSFRVLSAGTLYEDAEDNISGNWRVISGNYTPIRVKGGFHNSKGALVLPPEWIDDYTNLAEYHLDMKNSKEKILEVDMGGLSNYRLPNLIDRGYIQHHSIGVYVDTFYGKRALLWDSFFTHGEVAPFTTDHFWLNYPSPVEHVRGYEDVGGLPIDKWVHFRVNVDSELQKLEPNNRILTIETFFATGGFLDNLKLSAY